jgi:hypothetical protein
MRNCGIAAAVILGTAAAAAAAPLGLSGLSVGIGAGGIGNTDGYIQGEYDFILSRYVCLGPELMLGFGGGGAVQGGAAGRYYVIPDLHPIFQPHLAFGAGVAFGFDEGDDEGRGDGDDSEVAAYIGLAFGCDFDIPRSPVSPYLDLGGLFYVGPDDDADFNAEIGVRFAI